MKKIAILLSLIVSVSAQDFNWKMLPLNLGGDVHSIVKSNNDYYIAAGGDTRTNIYVSKDGYINFNRIGVFEGGWNSLIVTNNKIYGYNRNNNRGLFEITSNKLTKIFLPDSIASAYSSIVSFDTLLFLYSNQHGLVKSNLNYNFFEKLSSPKYGQVNNDYPGPSSSAKVIYNPKKNILIVFTPGDGLFSFDLNQKSWKKLNSEVGINTVPDFDQNQGVIVHDSSNVFFYNKNKSIYRASLETMNWSKIGDAPYYSSDMTYINDIFSIKAPQGGAGKVHFSIDSAKTWSSYNFDDAKNDSLGTIQRVDAIFPIEKSKFLIGTYRFGLAIFDFDNNKWEHTKGIHTVRYDDSRDWVKTHGSKIFTRVTTVNKLLYSNNYGDTWKKWPSNIDELAFSRSGKAYGLNRNQVVQLNLNDYTLEGISNHDIGLIYNDMFHIIGEDSMIVAGQYEVLFTIDKWENVYSTYNTTSDNPIRSTWVSNNEVYVLEKNGLKRTKSFGKGDWETLISKNNSVLNGNIQGNGFWYNDNIKSTKDGQLFLNTLHGLYLSKDDGVTWELLLTNQPNEHPIGGPIRYGVFDKRGNYIAVIDSSNASRGLYKYSNNKWSLARKTNRSNIAYLAINGRGDILAVQTDGLFINKNNKPVITKIDDILASKKTGTVMMKLDANDVEGDSIVFNLYSPGLAFTGVNSVNNYVKIDYPKDIVENYNITATASDSYLTDTTTFVLKVVENIAPVISALPDTVMVEDSTIVINLSANDDDGDLTTFSAVSDTVLTVSVSSNPTLTEHRLTIKPKPDWNGQTSIIVYASDNRDNRLKDSTSFNITVKPYQDPPQAFEWVSTAMDTVNITKDNTTSNYTLEWTKSKDVDKDTIDYIVYAKIGVYPAEEAFDTTSTSVPITYQELLENVFESFPMLPRVTVKFSVVATDGIDTVNVTGDDRVLFVNRYEFLSTEGEGIPTEFALHENYPNPFNPTTTLRFDLPEISDITLTIYNMLGQKVRTFNYQNTSAGYHSVTWDATNDYGEQVGAGVYLYQLQTKDFVKTRKMVLLK